PGGGRAWQFKHILIRDVAYESVPKEERSRLHDAAGRWLESVARERATEYAEIVAYHADQAHALARELRDPAAEALGQRALVLLLGAARRARLADENRAAYALYTRAADIAEAVDAPLATRVEAQAFAAVKRLHIDGPGAARAELDRALAFARSAGPSEPLVALLVSRLWEMGNRGIDVGAEAVATARATGDHDLVVEALISEAWPYWFAGDMNRCRTMLAAAREYAAAHDAWRHLEYLARRESQVALTVGDFDTFIRCHREWVLTLSTHESKIVRVVRPLFSAYEAAKVAGDFESALQTATEWLRFAPEFGMPGTQALKRLGRALLELGRYDEAVGYLGEALRHQEARGENASFVGETRQVLARAQLGAGRLEDAGASAERAYGEIKDDDPFSRSTTSAALAMVRQAQGKTAEADDLFRRAITAANGYLDVATEARVDYARFLIDQERGAEARTQLKSAYDFYSHPFVARRREAVDALLRRCDEVKA
ncbi:MAG TPA: hypothetical protein VFM06_01650, partial [Candidatus Limnocylindria bacterium]|nr:hypothetical protein [Candidatus Limnocylindria bacterium]